MLERLPADTSNLNTPLRWAAHGPGANFSMFFGPPFGALLAKVGTFGSHFGAPGGHFGAPGTILETIFDDFL